MNKLDTDLIKSLKNDATLKSHFSEWNYTLYCYSIFFFPSGFMTCASYTVFYLKYLFFFHLKGGKTDIEMLSRLPMLQLDSRKT